MKKLLLILLITALGFSMQAQSFQLDYVQHARVDTFEVSTVDTSWVLPFRCPYYGTIQVYWTELTGTLDGTLKMQQSSDSLNNWIDMNMSAHTMADTVGVIAFDITGGTGAHADKLRLTFTRGSITGGKFIPSVRLFKYR